MLDALIISLRLDLEGFGEREKIKGDKNFLLGMVDEPGRGDDNDSSSPVSSAVTLREERDFRKAGITIRRCWET